jgi:hypothetical protein
VQRGDASVRYRALRVFNDWLEEEGELGESPMRRMKPPAVPDQPIEVLTGSSRAGKDLEARRDTALIMLPRIGSRFGRIEPRRRALGDLQGLLGQVERNNSWWLAEQAGELVPDGMLRLLNGVGWDADGVRDVRDHVVEHLVTW